jgi:Winged helix DNA-binding domain
VADGDLLGPRALNRATLDRQLLLRRHAMPAQQAVTHLAGLQAQAPNAPYVGLWARLGNFAAGDLADLLTEREVVRAPLMQATVHLVTRADFAVFRPLLRPLMTGAPFGRNLEAVDVAELRAAAREHLAERPRTRTASPPHDRRPQPPSTLSAAFHPFRADISVQTGYLLAGTGERLNKVTYEVTDRPRPGWLPDAAASAPAPQPRRSLPPVGALAWLAPSGGGVGVISPAWLSGSAARVRVCGVPGSGGGACGGLGRRFRSFSC